MQLKHILISTIAAGSLFAQTPSAPKVNHVMAILTVKPDNTREQIVKVMQNEVRDTVALYLDGKIEQWYARGDGKGVVFILNCTTVAEAKAMLDKLPLVVGNLASFEFMPLGPLSPLRYLIAPQPPAQ